jgi:hypothetical protein
VQPQTFIRGRYSIRDLDLIGQGADALDPALDSIAVREEAGSA